MKSASMIKGFSSVEICWQFLYDIADQMQASHARGEFCNTLDLQRIEVVKKHFVLTERCFSSAGCEVSDVWALGAAAFELMLGSPVLNGMGEDAQMEHTPIPALCDKECAVLNQIIQRCMCRDTTLRPSLAAIKEVANQELQQGLKRKRSKRLIPQAEKKELWKKYDKKWPEKMGSLIRITMCVIMFLSGSVQVFCQSVLNSEEEVHTRKLIETTLKLRSTSAQAWQAAETEFSKRINLFTLMDELRDRKNDCVLNNTVVEYCGINRMLNTLKRNQSGKILQNTGRGLLDGADKRFNYSIYEKGIRKGCTATYQLSGRYGKQVFAIIPYDSAQPYQVKLSVKGKDTYVPVSKDAKGITYYVINMVDAPQEGEILILEITNKDLRKNRSFVVVNHNYRNK